MSTEIEAGLPAAELPSVPPVEGKPQPGDDLNALGPMPQFGETPMAPWMAQPIAPALPSARALAPADFQQQFVNRCLYPGKNVLDEGATAFSAPGIPDGTELMFKANGAEIGGFAFAPLLQPPAPQPDYFGHLLGHPMNPTLYEDDSIVSVEDDNYEPEAKKSVETPEDAQETVNAEEDESPVGKVAEGRAATPELAPTEDAESSDDSGDDDFDYFGHIMGHPMNRGNGRKKTPKPKKKSKKTKTEKIESDEPQVSVLNLFLGGVEVCDREENLSHFAKNEDSSMEESKEETQEAAADGDVEDNDHSPVSAAEQKTDQSALKDSPIKNVSALIEDPSKIDPPVELPEDDEIVPVDDGDEPEKTGGPGEPESAVSASPVAKASDEALKSKPASSFPKEINSTAQSTKNVANQASVRPDVPVQKVPSEKITDQVIDENAVSGRVRAAAPKKKSFFGSLCGSKN
ncbi:hypothetical protein FOZ63_018491 [Perkinsus olseni]|uniref:Uncharacterized protein n=1 Tax=Perkinsus olseni TaxID=32597 RepID=A0A7J6QHM4_PEROL|nr:hypothetical protein FOZ62_020477 [Perkinsus olseni]KAF4741817.1 hypothetical protein FOZ63_018491 [Perkinsus olseni]